MLNTLSDDDTKLSKCIFIDCKRKTKLKEYNKYYNKELQGYYLQWNYSKYTDKIFSHSELINKLPKELSAYLHSNKSNKSCYGRTDFINNTIEPSVINFNSKNIELHRKITKLLLSNNTNI